MLESMLRRLIFAKTAMGGALTEAIATGNPLTFLTDKAKPLKSLLVPFTPKQSGTGDPAPDNVRPIIGWTGLNVWRTGANVFDGVIETGAIDATTGENMVANSYIRSKNYISVVPGEKYFFAFTPTTPGTYNMRMFAYSSDKTLISTSWRLGGSSYTIPSGVYYIRFYMDTAYSAGADRDIAINYPSTDTEYHPYTGESFPVVFPALGKNLLNPAILEQGGIDSDGSLFNSVRRVRTGLIPVEAGKKYVCTANTGMKRFMHFYGENNVSIGSNQGGAAVAPTGSAYVRCIFGYENEDSIAPADVTQAQLEQSDSSSSPYEPFTNMVYGGALDVVSGVLSVEWASLTKIWGDFGNKTSLGDNTRGTLNISSYPSKPTSGAVDAKCNVAPQNSGWSTDSIHFYTNEGSCIVFLPNDTDASTEIQVVYPLATPQEIQLTPEQITALVGDNTIWSDTNGENTVVYLKKA